MRNGILYLNNHGTRWVIFKDGKKDMPILIMDKYGNVQKRVAICFKQFGNWTSVMFRYKGKVYDIIPDDYTSESKTPIIWKEGIR